MITVGALVAAAGVWPERANLGGRVAEKDGCDGGSEQAGGYG
jgi:hypothetical protein